MGKVSHFRFLWNTFATDVETVLFNSLLKALGGLGSRTAKGKMEKSLRKIAAHEFKWLTLCCFENICTNHR